MYEREIRKPIQLLYSLRALSHISCAHFLSPFQQNYTLHLWLIIKVNRLADEVNRNCLLHRNQRKCAAVVHLVRLIYWNKPAMQPAIVPRSSCYNFTQSLFWFVYRSLYSPHEHNYMHTAGCTHEKSNWRCLNSFTALHLHSVWTLMGSPETDVDIKWAVEMDNQDFHASQMLKWPFMLIGSLVAKFATYENLNAP